MRPAGLIEAEGQAGLMWSEACAVQHGQRTIPSRNAQSMPQSNHLAAIFAPQSGIMLRQSAATTASADNRRTDMSQAITLEQMQAMMQAMQAELAATKAALATAKANPAKITLKVGESGTVCVYHGARYPVALYAAQWERLLPFLRTTAIDDFIVANREVLDAKSARD